MKSHFEQIQCDTELYQNALALRLQVLRQPLGLTFTQADLAGEEQQLHFALVQAGQVVACVSFKPLTDQQLKLRQMAVSPEKQGQSLGQKLITQAESAVFALGYRQIQMAAREVAIGFYQKLGYQTQGEFFTEVSIPHIHMVKSL